MPLYAPHKDRINWYRKVDEEFKKCLDPNYVCDGGFITEGCRTGPMEFCVTNPLRSGFNIL